MPRQHETTSTSSLNSPAVAAAEVSSSPLRAVEGLDAQTAMLAPAGPSTYTVKGGDTLGAIAQRLLGSSGQWRTLWEANRSTVPDPNRIFPGQVLRVPGGGGGAAPTPVPAPATPRTYTVKSGDTLGAIAQRELGSSGQWRTLWEANRSIVANPNVIRPGMVLTIPTRGASGPATPAPIAPTPTPEAPTPSPSGGAYSAEEIRGVALRVTNVLETGGLDRYAAINDYDAGIISYGKHQVTLASGNLEALLNRYLSSASGPAASTLSGYMNRVRAKDQSLRSDQGFKRALIEAASDPAMHAAQESQIIQSHYNPAAKRANEWGIATPLGISMVYDTNLQGGMQIVLNRTRAALGGVIGENGITERRFLEEFNRQRRSRLLALANQAGLNTAHGRALRNSTYRCDEFDKLLRAGNFNLEAPLMIRGVDVHGLGG